jgi:hypothetical protein
MYRARPSFSATILLALALPAAACAVIGKNEASDGGGGGGGGATGGGGASGGGGAGPGSGGSAAGGATGTGGAGGLSGTGMEVDAGMRVDLTGRKALYIVDNTASPSTGDALLAELLKLRGMTVTFADVTGPASMATGQDVVIASSSASASSFVTTFKTVTVPMVVFGNSYFQPLDLVASGSSNKGSVDASSPLAIVDDSTSLSVDLKAGTSFGAIGTTRSTSLYWGTPAGAAIKVAAVGGNVAQSVVFAFEQGAATATSTAPARRVALGFKNDVIMDLSVDAFKLLSAAVEWTATAP